MRKLRFDLNKHLVTKDEEQKAVLPVETELNEQELATVTGGWGACEDCGDRQPPLLAPVDIGSYAGSLIRNRAQVRWKMNIGLAV